MGHLCICLSWQKPAHLGCRPLWNLIGKFLSLPVWSETSSCLVPINLMILKFGMYFTSQLIFFIEIISSMKSPILYCSMLLYLSLFCLEHASFVLRAADMYVYLNLSSWVMPLSEPKYLSFVRKLHGEVDMGCIWSIKSGEILGSAY